MPKPYPREFREDVVRVARNRGPGMLLRDIAGDFGISDSCLANWMKAADVEDGLKPGSTAAENAELREARKRIRLLEQETRSCDEPRPICLGRTCREKALPAREGARSRADRGLAQLQGARVVSPAVLPLARHAGHDLGVGQRPPGQRRACRPSRRPAVRVSVPVDEVRAAGFDPAERTVWKICSQNQWWSSFGKKRGRNGKKAGPPVHDDLLNRVFLTGRANKVWLTDISEHPTAEGKVYLCAVKDTWSNRIVGYSISDRMTSHLAVRALENAVARRGDVAGCIVHSDRGSQFRSRRFVAALTRHGMVGSMGRVGAAGDNAAMESFFALLQKNVLNTRHWDTREELRIAIVTWIERTYHRRRRQAVLGRLTPIEWEPS